MSKNKQLYYSENNDIVNDPKKVSEIFNDFFINVAKNIGNLSTVIDENHPSILAIKTNKPNTNTDTLTFKPVTSTFVDKQINKLNIKKATGFDGISAKMIKLAKPVVTGPITSLINKSIETSIFPDQLKVTQVQPLFKNKTDQLDKANYRPVSVLPAISKILSEQFLISSLLSLKTIFIPFCQLFVPDMGVKQPF